jgi:Fur family ferric uptake transcriptional regulator
MPGEIDDHGVAAFSKRTRQREAVLSSLADHPGFVSAQTLHARLRQAGIRIGLTTVYRTLHALSEAGLLDVIRQTRTPGHLFAARPTTEHQHYLVCRRCRRSVTITSRAVEQWATQLGHQHHFTDVDHIIELSGICHHCTPTPRHGPARA